MSRPKKILLTILILATLISLSAYGLIRSFGIEPLLWLAMPDSSQFQDHESKDTIGISLKPVFGEFSQITDFQFFPNSDHDLLVLQKTGELFRLDLVEQSQQMLVKLDVLTDSEQGLLGVAIHPDYPKIPCIYLSTVISDNGQDTSRVSEWCMSWDKEQQRWYQHKVIFELTQPYKNHNAGHLIFDQDGLLYIPWGDGGSGGDPEGNSQNLQSYLGKILRINPEAFNAELAYSVPSDNPFIDVAEVPNEIYAYGLRNPWKLAFDDLGRLIAADVGQNKWEEITFVEAGQNHGWNDIEALHCFKNECKATGTVLPFIEYGHDVGRSVTGGYQHLSSEFPALKGKYIFGDFVTGRLWASELPIDTIQAELNHTDQARTYAKVYELGQWPLFISSFARDHSGNIYLADYARGRIYKITKTQP